MDKKLMRKFLLPSAICISFAGLVSSVTGAWFIIGAHPFHRDNRFSEEFGMTEAQLNAFNPQIADWGRHVSDQVGSVSFGWGLFLITLALFGVLRGHKPSWIILWIAGIPTSLYSAFGEHIQFGTLDTGTLLSMFVFLLFLVGMLIPTRLFINQRGSTNKNESFH
jgi:hypothetical protein